MTRAEARRFLDRVRDGLRATPAEISEALRASGDIPAPSETLTHHQQQHPTMPGATNHKEMTP